MLLSRSRRELWRKRARLWLFVSLVEMVAYRRGVRSVLDNPRTVSSTTVYVELLGEAVDVWRPVAAVSDGPGVYRLVGEQPADEEWAFPPGSRVACELQALEGQECLVALARAR